MNNVIRIKRVYEEYSKSDGFRILVDLLWPRGLTKQVAQVDLWMKEIAPSNEPQKMVSSGYDAVGPVQKKISR